MSGGGAAGGEGGGGERAAAGFNPRVPSVARMYDYALGGKDHYEADRRAADEVLGLSAAGRAAARDSRDFLRRAVSFVAGQGVGQFIDIGAGLPAGGNTHEVARAACPGARVAYVDNDPVVVAHARALLACDPGVIAVAGDLREPGAITGNAEVTGLVDLERPFAVILSAVLHFVPDPAAGEVVDYLKSVMCPGSYLVVSHATADGCTAGEAATVRAVYARATPITLRTRGQVAGFFAGLSLIDPGVVDVNEWRRPGGGRGQVIGYGGVGRR